MTLKFYSFFNIDKTFKWFAIILFCGLNLDILDACAVEAKKEHSANEIRIKADSVVKKPDEKLIFKGKVSIFGDEWQISGDFGILKGAIDNSDEIIINGNPAIIKTDIHSQFGESLGSAEQLILDLRNNKLELVGKARYESNSKILAAEKIFYDLKTRGAKTKGSRIKFVSDR